MTECVCVCVRKRVSGRVTAAEGRFDSDNPAMMGLATYMGEWMSDRRNRLVSERVSELVSECVSE